MARVVEICSDMKQTFVMNCRKGVFNRQSGRESRLLAAITRKRMRSSESVLSEPKNLPYEIKPFPGSQRT